MLLTGTGTDTGAGACEGEDDREGTLLRDDGSNTIVRADTEGDVVTGADNVFEDVEAGVYVGADTELLLKDFKGRTGTVTGLVTGTEEVVLLDVYDGTSICLESPFPDVELLDTDFKGYGWR